MRFVAIFLTLLLGLSACTKKMEVHKDGASTRLSKVTWKVSKLLEGTWKVGRTLRDVVSRSLTVILDLPLIDDDDEEYLLKTYGIDSWLIKVTQINSSTSGIELGTLHVPFRGMNKGRAGGLQVKSASFALTYAASAMSERFRRFNCPAFSHNKRLDDYKVEGNEDPIEIVVMPGRNYDEKLKANELVPTMFNIGHTMIGEYRIEVALLNTGERKFYSSFKELPFRIKVSTEDSVELDGCSGVHEEFDAPKEQSVRGFMRGKR